MNDRCVDRPLAPPTIPACGGVLQGSHQGFVVWGHLPVLLLSVQAVLADPFTKVCPMVQQCMQADLQHLQDYYSGRPTFAEGGFRCQQRRLVLPACAAAPNAQPPLAAPVVDASLTCQDSRGRDGSSITVSVPATAGSGQPCAGADGSAPAELQAQGSAGGSLSRAPSGWLSRSGSGSSNARTGSGWRSYRRRLAPSCKELMYVCHGDRNGVVHYIATGECTCGNVAANDARHQACPPQPPTGTTGRQGRCAVLDECAPGWQGRRALWSMSVLPVLPHLCLQSTAPSPG